jgi:hypothetical protein
MIFMCKIDLIIVIGTLVLVFNVHHVNGLVFDSTREEPGVAIAALRSNNFFLSPLYFV